MSRAEHLAQLRFCTSQRLYNRGGSAPQSDPWNLDYALRDLVLVDLASETSKVIVRGKRIAKFEISPDGSCVG